MKYFIFHIKRERRKPHVNNLTHDLMQMFKLISQLHEFAASSNYTDKTTRILRYNLILCLLRQK